MAELTLQAYQAMVGDEHATQDDLKAHLERENATPTTDATPAETPPAETPKAEQEWKHPENWEEHYYDRKAIDELDPHAALTDEANPFHKLVKRVYGDPQRNEQHPFHKQASDLRAQASKAAEELRQERERKAELEKVLADTFSKPLVDNDNNPDLGKFGGIQPSAESMTGYVNAQGADVPFWQYQTAINAYERKQTERADTLKSREAQAKADREEFENSVKSLDSEYAGVKAKYADADPDKLWKEFSHVNRDGTPNSEFKGISAIESYMVAKYLRGEGGIEGFANAMRNEGREALKSQLIAKGLRLEDIPAGTSLTNTNTQPVKAVPVVKTPVTAAEIDALSDAEWKVRNERGEFRHLESPTPSW